MIQERVSNIDKNEQIEKDRIVQNLKSNNMEQRKTVRNGFN